MLFTRALAAELAKMGRGLFSVIVRVAGEALPVAGVNIKVATSGGEILIDTFTDQNGKTGLFALYAPSVNLLSNKDYRGRAYEVYNVTVIKPGFIRKQIRGVEIVDSQTSLLPVTMHPLGIPVRQLPGGRLAAAANGFEDPNRPGNPVSWTDPPEEVIEIPPIGVLLPTEQRQYALPSRVLRDVYVPESITVHLGVPNNNAARNVTVAFDEYIKNVASSEIFPSWPHNAILANIHCQVTFALNRVYTEWYRSRGYAFDITNSTAYDQYFVEGRNIFENISNAVDQVFNIYARRIGFKNPYFTQYCNGTTSTCAGLSQWGTVPLAEKGLEPLEILQYYYEDDLELVITDNITSISESYPGYSLKMGSQGEEVALIQHYLNRIAVNYPLIPQITEPYGMFGDTTNQAVKVFQSTFNLLSDGVVGRATWYKISFVYVGIVKLGELAGEGERIGIGGDPPSSVLRLGASGGDVRELQFIIDAVAPFYESVPTVIKDGYFGGDLENAVIQFQKTFGLTPDGIVGPRTWEMLYSVYFGIYGEIDVPGNSDVPQTDGPQYPGYAMRIGDSGGDVRLVQQYLSSVRLLYPTILPAAVSGEFDKITEDAVKSFQEEFMLTPDGIIGPETWNQLVKIYNISKGRQETIFEYPGTPLRLGASGTPVRTMQTILNELHYYYPEIPERPRIDGIFDESFRAAVTAFQSRFGLNVDGVIGPFTWNAVIRERSAAANREINAEIGG